MKRKKRGKKRKKNAKDVLDCSHLPSTRECRWFKFSFKISCCVCSCLSLNEEVKKAPSTSYANSVELNSLLTLSFLVSSIVYFQLCTMVSGVKEEDKSSEREKGNNNKWMASLLASACRY